VDVVIFGERNVLFRDGMFQIKDSLGAGVRLRKAGKLQHGRNVGHVFCAGIAHARAVREVVLTVRQHESALKQISGIVL
jgi:hypothetical protein